MKIRDIAEHLQQDLIEAPHDKPKKVRRGIELKFVRGFLKDGDMRCRISGFKALLRGRSRTRVF
jgi:hypothetical protein